MPTRRVWRYKQRAEPMPELECEAVVASLRSRIRFCMADWRSIPLPDSSIDVIFATNSIPRDDVAARRAVLREWTRLLRPAGHVFLAMHNGLWPDIGEYFDGLGWRRVNALDGEAPVPGQRSWQLRSSSG